MGRRALTEKMEVVEKTKKEEKLTPIQESIKAKILEMEGVVKDDKGKVVKEAEKFVNTVVFEPAPNNMTRIVRKYARGYTPFMETPAVNTEFTELFLSDADEDYAKFKAKMQTDQVREYLTADNKSYKEYVKGECDQPTQIRIMGNLDQVRKLTKAIINTQGLKSKIYDDEGNLQSGYIGLSKLECSKANRNSTYCQDSIRAYINMNRDESGETDKTVCKRYVGTKPNELEHNATFENAMLSQIKIDGSMRLVQGKIDKDDANLMTVQKLLEEKMYNKLHKIVDGKKVPVVHDKISSWEDGDVILYKDFAMSKSYNDEDYAKEMAKALSSPTKHKIMK